MTPKQRAEQVVYGVTQPGDIWHLRGQRMHEVLCADAGDAALINHWARGRSVLLMDELVARGDLVSLVVARMDAVRGVLIVVSDPARIDLIVQRFLAEVPGAATYLDRTGETWAQAADRLITGGVIK